LSLVVVEAKAQAEEAKNTILETAVQVKDAAVEKAQEVGQAVSDVLFVLFSRLIVLANRLSAPCKAFQQLLLMQRTQ
jgi:hypothetical protein